MKDLKDYINKLRFDFSKDTLDEADAEPNAIIQFEKWFREAVEVKVNEPNAMMLATVGKDRKPSARIVLLRNFNEFGFVFYTNYGSHKSKQSEENAAAALTFFWPELERQIRIEGFLEKQTAEESDSYFASRPRESKLGAWVSPQSQVIKSRKDLEDAYKEADKKFSGEIPRPPYWGGYLLKASTIEFWQGRPGRLHDRILYSHVQAGWKLERLAP
jgi:pyridoxamine 5'-phosphate oxidase